jgi:hypothetical protein
MLAECRRHPPLRSWGGRRRVRGLQLASSMGSRLRELFAGFFKFLEGGGPRKASRPGLRGRVLGAVVRRF